MGGKQRIMTLYSESDLDLPFGKNGKFSFQLGYTPVVSDMKKIVRKAVVSTIGEESNAIGLITNGITDKQRKSMTSVVFDHI